MRQKVVLYAFVSALVLAGCAPKFMTVATPGEIPAPMKMENPPRVALVLGGGSFHAIAHLGVLKVLEEEHIPLDLIVGCSSGSLIGGLYASRPYADSIIPLVNSAKMSGLFDVPITGHRTGYIKGKKLQEYIARNTGITRIEETRIPFVAVATDLFGETVTAFSSGPIAPAINASCAIPIIFRPVEMYGTLYVDGGVLDIVPTDVAASYGPQVIIAVDVASLPDSVITIKNYKDIALQSLSAARNNLKEEKLKLADVLIAPYLFGIPSWSDKYNQEVYDAGVKAAKAAIPTIRKILIERNIIH